MDSALRIDWVNTALQALLHFDRDLLRGVSLPSALVDAGCEMLEDEVGATSVSNTPQDRSGMRLNLAPGDAGGVATLTDVTAERIGLEDLLEHNRIRDQLMYDAAVGVWRYDPDEGRLRLSHAMTWAIRRQASLSRRRCCSSSSTLTIMRVMRQSASRSQSMAAPTKPRCATGTPRAAGGT